MHCRYEIPGCVTHTDADLSGCADCGPNSVPNEDERACINCQTAGIDDCDTCTYNSSQPFDIDCESCLNGKQLTNNKQAC